ncbi:MAG: SRPBCC family protein [Ferruginibacter sp.]
MKKNNITANTIINIRATASEVWNALTRPRLIKQYFYGAEAISDFREGSPITFKGEWEGLEYENKGTILMVEKDKLFRYEYWNSMSGTADIRENYLIITHELFEDGGVTTLTITQENILTEEKKVKCEQNWRKLTNNLKELVEWTSPLVKAVRTYETPAYEFVPTDPALQSQAFA